MDKKLIIKRLVLLVVSILLFFLSQPNPLFKENSFWICGWGMFFFVLIVVQESSFKESIIFGFIYGLLATVSHAFWLTNTGIWSLMFVFLVEGIYYSTVFGFLKFCDKTNYSFIVQVLVWGSFEYLRSLGFLGLSYGIIGYSQWNNSIILQSADLFGIWGINILILFPSSILAYLYKKKKTRKKIFFEKSMVITTISYITILVLIIIYGVYHKNKIDYYDENLKICLVQTNIDTTEEYDREQWFLEEYKKILDPVLEIEKDIDLIVFPELSITPRILLDDGDFLTPKMYLSVIDYLNYFYGLGSSIILGGKELVLWGKKENINSYDKFNCAIYLAKDEKKIPPEYNLHRKTHLVPFIEDFPLFKKLPLSVEKKIYRISSVMAKGNDFNIFSINGFNFCSPICFEESFGKDVLNFTRQGTSFITCIASDNWSKSDTCKLQHMAMGVFRAVESRQPFLRSSMNGKTIYINKDGKVERRIDSQGAGVLLCSVPVKKVPSQTLYMKVGDSLGIITVILTLIFMIIELILKGVKYEKEIVNTFN